MLPKGTRRGWKTHGAAFDDPGAEGSCGDGGKTAVTTIISAETPDYGAFLESLVDQVGLTSRRVPPESLTQEFLEGSRPTLVVVETRQPIPSELSRCVKACGVPLTVVSENAQALSSLSSDNGHGVWGFRKPLDPSAFVRCLGDFVEKNGKLPEDGALWEGPYLIGIGEAMRNVRRRIARIAATDLGVLIRGETGAGKGIAAMAIHNNSSRRHGPFVQVNCSSIPPTLLESELFGYRKGAFTGAYRDKPGKFDLARGGSLFLDEISDMSPFMQAKLLQVLQDSEYAPLGHAENIRTDVRIFAASNAPLEEMMARGQFRQDLYFRLNVVLIELPPLRERLEDIRPLTQYFLNKYAALFGCPVPGLSQELCALMELYDWPGNVRELENCIKGLVALGNDEEVLKSFREKVRRKPVRLDAAENPNVGELIKDVRQSSLREVVQRIADEVERRMIYEALKETRGNKRKAAELLGVSPRTLYKKMCSFDLEGAESFRTRAS